MKKNNKKMINLIILAVICAVIAINLFHACTPTPSPEEVKAQNEATYEACKEDLLTCIAFVEGFKSKPYFCGAKWTIGYGTTVFPKGTRVTKKAKPISKDYAKECVFAHCDKRIKPFILKYVTRVLDKEEMLGTCLFVYNVGGEQFSGYRENGKKVRKESAFLTSLNKDDDRLETCQKMTGFRASAGKRANGLLKRHWIQSAIFMGILTPEDLMNMKPAGFYQQKVSFYYDNLKANKDGYWEYNFSPEKVKKFVKQNSNAKNNVRAIL